MFDFLVIPVRHHCNRMILDDIATILFFYNGGESQQRMHAVAILSSCFFFVCHAQNESGNSNDALYHVGSLSFKSILTSTLQPSTSPSASPSMGPTPFPTKQVSALLIYDYLVSSWPLFQCAYLVHSYSFITCSPQKCLANHRRHHLHQHRRLH